MSYEISKELFEAVMNFKVDNVSITTVYANIDVGLRYERKETLYTIVDCVGIDTFFFKCKEWAFDKFSYEIYTSTTYGYTLSKENNLVHESISLESEQQYCFDACQWILDNKG